MKWFRRIVMAAAVVGTVAIVALMLAPKPALPLKLASKASFAVWISKSPGITTDRDSAVYDAGKKYLRYQGALDGIRILVNEQPTPAAFVDESASDFTKFLANLGEYGKFEVQAGIVHLVRPASTGERQAAVINARGTLVFVQPDTALSDDQWRKYFKNFTVLN